ncbi:hypothetical protein CLI92_00550 [Vandammella animalimorsus]|uniref:Glycosyltransferase subfamily 4-like N-terminal domain-containing protein n=1 Tax=Vandammella animalimorsus TaxID=2029117 RepID=A0A2A2T994_9BURK|nr:glycosyltransferase [Vandammella animalimorsus]PAX18371.1 hypothetical protein CLI92_00550 [Vandammella animalimorsus]
MKSLLIVTEQFTLGGLETHIRGEIEYLSKAGVTVHLAAGKAFEDALLPAELTSITHGLPLGPECSPEELLSVIQHLRQIIRRHAIGYVHIHPFTSIIPAVAAAELESVPYAITLHGPASMASYGPIYDLLVKDIILPSTPLIVAVSPEVQDLLSIHASDQSVAYIPNSVLFEEPHGANSAVSPLDPRWLVVSRMDEFKIQGIFDFCRKAKACGIPGVVIAGDGPAKQQLCQMLEEHGDSDYVELIGPSNEIPTLIQKFSGIAGMGRVVLEGVSSHKPVVLVGYDGVKGVVDEQLLTQAAEHNFSGRNLPVIDDNELLDQLGAKTGREHISDVFEFARTHFNAHHAWTRFLDKMSSIPAPATTVLTGLHHHLSTNTITGTTPYLYSKALLDQIEAVVCSKKFYDPRLLAAVSLCRQRQASNEVNLAVAERDGQIASLNLALAERDEQIASLSQTATERDGQLTHLNQAVSERDERLAHLNQTVVERDSQLAHLNQSVAERDEQLVNLNQTIVERNGQLSQLNQAITERDGQIASLNLALAERDAQIAHLNQTVVERDSQLAHLNQSVAERDEQLVNLNQTIVERNGQLSQLNQAITERDGQIANQNLLLAERDGQLALLNQAVAERDGQLAKLNQTVAERDGEINALTYQITNIKQSNSWKITSPFRVTKNLVISPKRTAYSIVRKLFWSLPSGVRQSLHGPRHAFVRYVRGLPARKHQDTSNQNNADLSWSEFNETVLANRAEYKGIFVQEAVIDWNVPLYQRPQHISSALGRLGYLVIYRTVNWVADDVNGFRKVGTNVWVTNSPEVDTIHDVIRSIYSTAYVQTPDLIMQNGKRGRIIYEYIDHIDPEISGDNENIKRLLNQKKFAFEGGADYVIASAKKLYDEAASIVGKEKVIMVPNGVDTRHYRSPTHLKTIIPQSLVDFKEKHKAIVGYFGAIAPWLWYEVMSELAAMRPDLGFVFIGPDYYGGIEKLPKFENVLYMGTVDYKELPAYARQFDICFIPFKPGDIAKTTSPLKLFEYFALEKPVVVTSDMDECTAYSEVFKGGSAADLSHAFDSALQVKDSKKFKSKLRTLADKNDWRARAKALEECFKGLNNE